MWTRLSPISSRDFPGWELRFDPICLSCIPLTKFYAVPGLRLGLGYGDADICAAVSALLPDWSVNALAQAVGEEALRDDAYAERSLDAVQALRSRLEAGLGGLGITVFPGSANYLLCRSEIRTLRFAGNAFQEPYPDPQLRQL